MKTTAAQIIATFEGNIRSLEADLHALTDAERVLYIVTCSDLPINVLGEPGLGGMVCPVRDATRFGNWRDAQSFADRVVNGQGERGKIVTLGSAYINAIDDLVNQISYLDANAD
jgi:hypothetical protein